MINTLSLLVGIVGVGIICIRAFMLDRTVPWFKPAPLVTPKKKLGRYGQ